MVEISPYTGEQFAAVPSGDTGSASALGPAPPAAGTRSGPERCAGASEGEEHPGGAALVHRLLCRHRDTAAGQDGRGPARSSRRACGGTRDTGRHPWRSATPHDRQSPHAASSPSPHPSCCLGFRDRNDVDADGDRVRPDEAAGGADAGGHAGAVSTPAERLRPEPADRRGIKSLHVHHDRSQCHADDPVHPVCNDAGTVARPRSTRSPELNVVRLAVAPAGSVGLNDPAELSRDRARRRTCGMHRPLPGNRRPADERWPKRREPASSLVQQPRVMVPCTSAAPR